MKALNVAQLENTATFCDPLPTADTMDRMEQLFRSRRALLLSVANKRELLNYHAGRLQPNPYPRIWNELTQAERRLRDTIEEIVAVAEQIVAEDRAGECVTV